MSHLRLSAMVACPLVAVLLFGAASRHDQPDTKKQEEVSQKDWDELKKSVADLAAQNKSLSDDLVTLTKDFMALKSDHNTLLKTLRTDVDANKKDADARLLALKENEDENLLVKWIWSDSKSSTDENGKDFTVDFKTVEPRAIAVRDATAFVNRHRFSYGSDDHHVQTLLVAVNVTNTTGTKVTVHYRASMHDNSRNNAGGDIEFLVMGHVVVK